MGQSQQPHKLLSNLIAFFISSSFFLDGGGGAPGTRTHLLLSEEVRTAPFCNLLNQRVRSATSRRLPSASNFK